VSQDEGWGTPAGGAGEQPPAPWQQPGQAQPPPAATANPWDTVPGQQPTYGQPGYGQPGYGQPGYGQAPPASAGYGAVPSPGGQTPYGFVPQQAWRPKPGIIPLRPITLGEIYDGAFQAIRTNPKTMMGVAAAVLAVTTLLQLLPQSYAAIALGTVTDRLSKPSPDGTPAQLTAQDASAFAQFYGLTIVPALITGIAVTVVTALLVVAVSEAVLGRRMAPGPLWRRVRRRIPGILGVALLPGLAMTALLAVIAVPVVALAVADQVGAAVAVGGLGFILWFVLVVYLSVSWSMAGPALLLENLPVVPAFNRSRRLVDGSWWRIAGISLLTTLIVGTASGAVQFPASLVGGLITGGGLGGGAVSGTGLARVVLGQLVAGVGTLVAGSVLYPFQASVNALLYIDLRMRREGLDVDLMRAAESGAR
jgi:hypothetical protein